MEPSKKILLVEDEEPIRNLYARELRTNGYEVVEAEDGEEGYKQILAGNFDLILLDIMLPEIDGTEILRRVREEPEAKHVTSKIVMLTNLDFESVKAKTEAYKVDGYIVKSKMDVLHLADMLKAYF